MSKNCLKRIKKDNVHCIITVLSILSSIALIVLTVMAILKLKEKEEDSLDGLDENFCDENGCYYVSDDDFE